MPFALGPFASGGKGFQLEDKHVHNLADPEEEGRENFIYSSAVIIIIIELMLY